MTEKTNENSIVKPSENPSENPSGKPSENPTRRPDEKPTGKPGGKPSERPRERSTTESIGEVPSLVGDPNAVVKVVKNERDEPVDRVIDLSISRNIDPVPANIRQAARRQANIFIRKQRIKESEANKDDLKERQDELTMRRNFDEWTVREIMLHPYYERMMKTIAEEMIEEEKLWRRYKRNKLIRDTETSRRRIQNAVPMHVMEYAIKYNKKPWRYPGKSKIKTKFYEKVDWVDDPFVVLEEKTEKKFEQESVKTSV